MACKCAEPAVGAEERLAGSDSDDIWGEDDVAVDSAADVKRSHEKQGYLDGKTRANEANLQQGFDEAFPQGARLGMVVGSILARVAATGDDAVMKQARSELNIEKVLSKKYFDDELQMAGGHEVLEKWQKLVE